jgi:hypothetical protein
MYIDPQTTIHYNLAQFEENLSKNVTCSQQTIFSKKDTDSHITIPNNLVQFEQYLSRPS